MKEIIAFFAPGNHRRIQIGIHLLVILLLITGCSPDLNLQPSPTSADITPTSPQSISEAVVTFNLQIPDTDQTGVPIFIDILDEVTGLALNPARYQMDSIDTNHYTISLPIRVNELLKYRYVKGDKTLAVEYTPTGNQVRYRLLVITNPMVVEDTVSGWTDNVVASAPTKIEGKVLDNETNQPIASVLVCAGGSQALTASDGSFTIEGLPVGTHNLVAMTLDGSYQVFEQGARVDVNATTPVEIRLTPSKYVSVTFLVTIPNEISGVPIRLAGDLYSLGNTFADLEGGLSTVASRMPILSPLSDGRQTITLFLPVGTDLHYKYSLGDGFWNSEHNLDGSFNLRELIVPAQDIVIEDTIATWKSGNDSAVTFTVSVPSNTPASDIISIQFNPYGWTESIPMWSLGNNNWMYILYSPLNLMNNLSYRYCRNDECSIADDSMSQGSNPAGRSVEISATPQAIEDSVASWVGWQPESTSTTVSAESINPRNGFIAGVEFQTGYQPSRQSYYLNTLQNLSQIGTGWVFMTPTWTYPDGSLPNLELIPGENPLLADLEGTIGQIESLNMQAALFPQPVFPTSVEDWWVSAARDTSWWNAWFENYERFLLNFADIGEENHVSALVIGGDWLSPALPGGLLPDGSASGVPADSESRWKAIIENINLHFSGTIIWALPYSGRDTIVPSYIENVDAVYLLFNQPVSEENNPDEAALIAQFSDIFDNEIKPFKDILGKPIIMGISYPSAQGSAGSCLVSSENTCVPPSSLNKSGEDQASITLDLQSQKDLYDALMVVINQRDWIDGFVSRGFFPPVAVQDQSTSVYGKPAYDVIWYWFSGLLGE
jgi:hypothetical protein